MTALAAAPAPLESAYFTFRPRPDRPELYDEQEGFYNSDTQGVAFFVGGNGSGTSEVALAKVARFVFETPPPRKDTPFWILSDDYPTVMESAWKEKLHGHGHIPTGEVDWERVQWYKPNMDWPFRVPLKPHPGNPDTNWMLEFKAYGQGRHRLQARSIGGFCFIEQFPWGLLEEVLRGCREYNFRGSKFCEFTPVDPNLSIEIEEILDGTRKTPNGWEFYRANTQCAVDAGHVSQSWFDEFFGMIPGEMRETRMTGAFASYEGAIYQTFNPAIHCVGDAEIDFPPGVHYRRGIDWGAGPSNAFAGCFAYKNGLGQWYVFDEYYSTEQTYTTIDHLCEISDRWLWPANNPYFGVTYADPSSPDDIRIAGKLPLYTDDRYDTISMRGANNSVLEGIEHVQWLLKPTVRKVDPDTGEVRMEPRLFIHRENCPNLVRQMKSYRWMRASEAGLNPISARREPLKREDHIVDALRYLVFSESQQQGTAPESMRREDRSRRYGIHLDRGGDR